MNILILVSAIVSATEVDFENFNPAYLSEFSKGFFAGVNDESADCSLAVSGFMQSFSRFLESVSTYDGSYVPILTSFSAVKEALLSVNEDCKIRYLTHQVHKMLGPNGKTTMMKNYFLNLAQINKDLVTMRQCSSDFFTCGKATGEAFRLVSGYRLQLAEASLEATSQDILDLIYGFAITAEWTVTENCVELTGKFENLKSIVAQIQTLMNSPAENMMSIMHEVSNLMKENKDVADCAMQYGGVALYAMPSIFFNKQVWNNAWESESDTLTSLFSKMTVTCHKDYKACGSYIAQVFNTLGAYIEDL